MSTAEWVAEPIDPASRGWCGECGWEHVGEWAHKHAQDHGTLLGHITHVHEPDDPSCRDIYVSGLIGVTLCIRTNGHKGLHRDRRGVEWSSTPVDKSVENR